MNKLNWGKFSIIFRALLIMIFCAFFGSSVTFANSTENNFQLANSNNFGTLIASAEATLPQLNQSTELIRNFQFNENQTVTLEENMGTTEKGAFTINGVNAEQNSIVFNQFSGFVVSKIQTTLEINNVTITGAESAIGSAIYNTATDAKITINNTNFESNSTLSQGDALGGAIYSNGRLTLTNTSFIGNSAIAETTGTEAKGGAIYSKNSVNMIADGKNVVIKDNFTQNGDGVKMDNAIYIDNSSATLNISAINSGTFAISDSINGANGYNVVLTGDRTGTIGLYNSIYNANISVSNVNISFADGKTSAYTLDNLNVGNNVNFIIDGDLANGIADTITSANGNGTINISQLNVLSAPADGNATLQVLKDGGNLTLNIDKLKEKHLTNVRATMYNDTILADSLELGTTDKENDSIVISGWKDVLYEMVQDKEPIHMIKNFIFRTNTEYVLTRDLGEMPQESILTMYNQSGAQYGTLNANGNSLFELTNPISIVSLMNIEVKNAYTDKNGAVARIDNNTASFSAENSLIHSNTADENGGAFYVKNGTLSLKDSTVTNNNANGNGGAIHAIDNAKVELVNVDFISNSSNGKGGAIYTESNVSISAKNGSSTFQGNTANGESNAIHAGSSNATINLDARNKGTINMNDKITGESGYKLNITGNSKGNVNLNNTISDANVTLRGSNLNLAKDNLLAGNEFNARGGRLNLINGEVGDTNFSKLSTSGKTTVAVDVDLANKTMDRLTTDSYGKIDGTINVNKLHLLSDSKKPSVNINFASGPLKDNVTSPVRVVSYSRIYKYLVYYNQSGGYFSFNRGDGKDATSFNPAILPTGIAQQTAYMNELQNYDASMYHSDTYMMLPEKVRFAYINQHYANDFDNIEGQTYLEKYLAIPEEIKTIWVRPYASFEKIPLKHGPTVSSINYGTVFGGDSDMIHLKHGFKFVYGGYVGYNANNTSYMNVDSMQQGSVIGATGNIYKGNFFNTITANVGWMINNSDTEYGTDTMNIIMSGFADKIGYNIEINSGKVIIQPSLMMGYTFVHSSDYETSDGVYIESEPLNVMHFCPALKIICNLANGWQPYFSVRMMCNFDDKTQFTASTVRIPEMSIDPYVEWGFGVQKRWKDKYSGFAQATVRNGGRRGVALLFGFRYMIGKIISREHFIVHENLGKRKTLFKERKEPEIEIGSLTPKEQNKTKPSTPVADGEEKGKIRFNIMDGLKKVSRIIFFKYNTDVSAKVVTDVYPDGVIRTTLKGMESEKYKNNNASSDFKDKDLINRKYQIKNTPTDSNLKNKEPKQTKSKQDKVEIKPAVQIKVKPQDKVETKPAVKVQTKKDKVEQKTSIKPDTKEQTKQQNNIEAKPDVKVQAKQDKVEQKTSVKPEAREQTKQQNNIKTKPDIKVQAKQDKVEQKTDVKTQVKKQSKEQQKTKRKTAIKLQTEKQDKLKAQIKEQKAKAQSKNKVVQKPFIQIETKLTPQEKITEIQSSIPSVSNRTPKRVLEVNHINNKQRLYLNQSKYIKPIKVDSFKDYSTEVVNFQF